MSLMLMIYAVNCLGTLSSLLGVIGVVGAILFALYTFIWLMCENDRYTDSVEPGIHNTMKTGMKVWAFLVFLFVVTPDRGTMILLSSAMIGERILENPAVVGVVDPSIDLLKTWMQKQTKDIQDSMIDKKDK